MKHIKKLLLLAFVVLPTQSHAQQDFNKSPVAMAYVCWQLASGLGYERDSDSFSKMISMLRKMPEFKSEQHYELMGYAAKHVLHMDLTERDSMYKYGCLEPLENIKRAEQQGMLN